jgi:hypothetical protein
MPKEPGFGRLSGSLELAISSGEQTGVARRID